MIDLEALEKRVLAHLAHIQLSEDPHRDWAAEQLGIAPEDVTPEQRAAAKHLRFVEIYGGSKHVRLRKTS